MLELGSIGSVDVTKQKYLRLKRNITGRQAINHELISVKNNHYS